PPERSEQDGTPGTAERSARNGGGPAGTPVRAAPAAAHSGRGGFRASPGAAPPRIVRAVRAARPGGGQRPRAPSPPGRGPEARPVKRSIRTRVRLTTTRSAPEA